MAVSQSASTDKTTLPTSPSVLDNLAAAGCTICQWAWSDGNFSSTNRGYGKGLAAAIHSLDIDTGGGGTFTALYGRATTNCVAGAVLTNFTAWATGKWIFCVGQNDTTTAGNNKVWMGDLDTLAAEPSSYNLQSAGSGAHTSNAGAAPTIGNRSSDARPWLGRIAQTIIFPFLLSQRQIWSVQFDPFSVPGYVANIHSWSTTMVIDYSGNKFNGTVTGSANVGHIPQRPIFGSDTYGQNYATSPAATIFIPLVGDGGLGGMRLAGHGGLI